MASGSRRATSAALAFLAIALIAIWWWRRGGDDAAAPPPTTVATPTAAPPTTTVVPTKPPEAPMAPIVPADQPPIERLKREYENYRKSSIYPHWSIPLTPDMDFALEWNKAVTSDLELGDGLVVRFDGNAGRVFGKEPYTATIAAWRTTGGKDRVPVAVRVERAAVSVTNATGGAGNGEVFEVAFHDDGQDGDAQAGDRVLSTRFVPADKKELAHASAARIEAYVVIDGADRRQLVRDFVFAPREVLEVRALHDRAKDGSLVATVDCEVHEQGVYTFYANLLAGDGAPIAMTKLSFPLEPGKRSVDLTFFGKVIADRGLAGPYTIKDVHGLRRSEHGEPDVWWTYAPAYQTAPYAASDFSSAEWNDPERTQRLANFERVIHEMEAQQR